MEKEITEGSESKQVRSNTRNLRQTSVQSPSLTHRMQIEDLGGFWGVSGRGARDAEDLRWEAGS